MTTTMLAPPTVTTRPGRRVRYISCFLLFSGGNHREQRGQVPCASHGYTAFVYLNCREQSARSLWVCERSLKKEVRKPKSRCIPWPTNHTVGPHPRRVARARVLDTSRCAPSLPPSLNVCLTRPRPCSPSSLAVWCVQVVEERGPGTTGGRAGRFGSKVGVVTSS